MVNFIYKDDISLNEAVNGYNINARNYLLRVASNSESLKATLFVSTANNMRSVYDKIADKTSEIETSLLVNILEIMACEVKSLNDTADKHNVDALNFDQHFMLIVEYRTLRRILTDMHVVILNELKIQNDKLVKLKKTSKNTSINCNSPLGDNVSRVRAAYKQSPPPPSRPSENEARNQYSNMRTEQRSKWCCC